MTAPVPLQRSFPQLADAQVSAAVRGRTWRELAHLHHWLHGHGRMLVPAHHIGAWLTDGPWTGHYRVQPSATAIARVWQVSARGGTLMAVAKIRLPNGSEHTIAPPTPTPGWPLSARSQTYYLIEHLAAKSSALQTLSITAEGLTAKSEVVIESVACWELPRAALTVGDAVDLGIDIDSFRPGSAIFDDPAGRRSAAALARALDQVDCKRVLHQHSFPTLTATANGRLYPRDAPVVPRNLGEPGATVHFGAWVRSHATWSLETLLNGSDATFTTVNPMGSFQMVYLGSVDWAVPEDLNSDDGMPPSPGDEGCDLFWYRQSGTGPLEIGGFYVWE